MRTSAVIAGLAFGVLVGVLAPIGGCEKPVQTLTIYSDDGTVLSRETVTVDTVQSGHGLNYTTVDGESKFVLLGSGRMMLTEHKEEE